MNKAISFFKQNIILTIIICISILGLFFEIIGAFAFCSSTDVGMNMKVFTNAMVIIVIIFAIGSTIFSIVGPKIQGRVINAIFDGLVSKITGVKGGGIDFDYIGKIMIAEKDIDEKSEIKVSGIYWTVINKGSKINKGDKFVITGIEGNKLTVKLKED